MCCLKNNDAQYLYFVKKAKDLPFDPFKKKKKITHVIDQLHHGRIHQQLQSHQCSPHQHHLLMRVWYHSCLQKGRCTKENQINQWDHTKQTHDVIKSMGHLSRLNQIQKNLPQDNNQVHGSRKIFHRTTTKSMETETLHRATTKSIGTETTIRQQSSLW